MGFRDSPANSKFNFVVDFKKGNYVEHTCYDGITCVQLDRRIARMRRQGYEVEIVYAGNVPTYESLTNKR